MTAKHQFTVQINAGREKVWSVLWNDDTYGQWTGIFAEGSCAKTDWKKGSKVIFTDEKGMGGMVSKIADIVPNEFMSFEHQGEIKDGVEDTTSEKVKEWTGAMENYTLTDNDGGTRLVVEMDLADAYAGYFKEKFPKALDIVKKLAES